MKGRLAFAAAGLLLGLVAVAAILGRAYTVGNGEPEARVEVEAGATLQTVADRLAQRGLLGSRRVFLLAARLSGRDRALQVGTFVLPADASARDILAILVGGPPVPVVVTLREGLEAADMVALVADSLRLDPDAILAAADRRVQDGADTLMAPQTRDALAAVVAGGPRPSGRPLHWCEGYLAPDTYHFTLGLDAAHVAAAMVDLQLSRLAQAGAQRGRYHELLTLASLVESEARLPQERSLIAAVYRNRLQRGLRLEADPTVAFWLGKRGQRLLYRDLEVDSPYNTYRRSGLPLAPIMAPGAAAVAAAAAPDSLCRALYFVADGEGGHVFSETLDEHNRAVARYRELMRTRRR
ncbi:MAG: endolytic transglycosylase MltG [Candidatus Krumholzibacteriia bacterium]